MSLSSCSPKFKFLGTPFVMTGTTIPIQIGRVADREVALVVRSAVRQTFTSRLRLLHDPHARMLGALAAADVGGRSERDRTCRDCSERDDQDLAEHLGRLGLRSGENLVFVASNRAKRASS